MSVQYSRAVVVYRHVWTESVVLPLLSVVHEASPETMVLPLLDLLETGTVSDHEEGQMQAVAIPIRQLHQVVSVAIELSTQESLVMMEHPIVIVSYEPVRQTVAEEYLL